MTVSQDLDQNEIKALFEITGDLSGKQMLEIGCGDGRLTWRYASQAARVVAIDTDPEKVSRARQDLPAELSDRVSFLALGLEEYVAQYPPHNQANKFDLVLLAWSL
jgi:cyclopropane fatty-acyl-phospholipid synthase-like methyltransferase